MAQANAVFDRWKALRAVLVPTVATLSVPAIRRTAQRLNYPAKGRAWVQGSGPRSLSDVLPDQLLTAIVNIADLNAIQIMHRGSLRSAASVFAGVPQQQMVAAISQLYGTLIPHLGRQELDDTALLGRLVGEETYNYGRKGYVPSLEERALRATEAALTLFADGLDLGMTPDDFFSPRTEHLRDAVAEFIRSHVVRNGHEHGLRSAFARQLEAEGIVPSFPGINGLRHEVRFPLVVGDRLEAGADTFVYAGEWALNGEWKAYSTYQRLLSGAVSLTADGVRGPEIARQALSHARRLSRWGWMVPGPGVAMPTSAVLTSTTGWRRVPPFVYFVIDDVFLFNNGFAQLSAVMVRKGNVAVDVMQDLAAPLAVRRMMVKIYGPVIQPGVTAEQLWETGLTKFATVLQEQEVKLNRQLAKTPVDGQIVTVRLIPGTLGVRGMLERMIQDEFIEDPL